MRTNVEEKTVHGEIVVNAGLEEVWNAWTTEAGAKTFFAPACNIDLRPDGPYEIFFNPDAPPGERGGEGLRVLAAQPMQMFSFTWNAPPSLPEVRGQRTHVTLRFFAEEEVAGSNPARCRLVMIIQQECGLPLSIQALSKSQPNTHHYF